MGEKKEKKSKAPEVEYEKEHKQHGLFKKTRGGQPLTQEQVREIKEGRKKIKAELKAKKIYSKKEFELTCSSMGLYFDKTKAFAIPLWFLHGRGLTTVLIAGAGVLGATFLSSMVSQMQGHFTINLTDDMFRRGFVLSEDEAFTNPTSVLYSDMVEDAPCISIVTIPTDVDDHDGNHNTDTYFAYTFYIGYEGPADEEVAYSYELAINSESKDLSKAAWAMLFVDGQMIIYAEQGADGKSEALPARDDLTRGYRNLQILDQAAYPEEQYEIVATKGSNTYYRILTEPFLTDEIMAAGIQEGVKDGDIHKFTVVLWLEGDDPDCTDELIGGHLGVEMNFRLLDSEDGSDEDGYSLKEAWEAIWESLKFWES